VVKRNKSQGIIVLVLITTSRNTIYRLLGAVLVLAGIGVFYLAASADRPAQNEPEALRRTIPKSPMRTETIEAAARGAWRAIPDTAHPPEPALAVTVTPAARTALPAARDTASPLADRTVLIRDLQRELKRVGCYEGEIHGVWTKSTRDAMERFTELANAKLPTHEPDIVLLSLVRGHAGNTGCDQSVITATAPNAASPRAPPLEGYMALAGPPAEAPAPSAAPPRHNPRTSEPHGQTGKGDWIAKLWKKQGN
jgi:Putative peptidoglycan binding domain